MTPDYLLRELEAAHDAAKDAAMSCSLCWLEQRQVTRYLTGVANDGVNNIPLRQKLAERGGYCATHCHDFAEIANPLSGAILLEAFLSLRLKRSLNGKRPVKLRCEACEAAEKTRQTFHKNIKQHRKSEKVQQVLTEADLCLMHLELVCQVLPGTARERLVSEHNDLSENLSELIRKHDYRFSDESLTEAEKRSIAGALELFGVETKAKSA